MIRFADTGSLRKPFAIDYLRKDRANKIVISWGVLDEVVRGDSIGNLRSSFQNLKNFYDRILLLKQEHLIYSSVFRQKNAQQLIDYDASHELSVLIGKGFSARGADVFHIENAIFAHGVEAVTRRNQNRDVAISIKKSYINDINLFSAAELRDLKHRRMGSETRRKLGERINASINVAAIGVFPGRAPFNAQVLKGLFLTRTVVVGYASLLYWAINGGIENRDIDRLVNDISDEEHIAYSTFFDGILSADKRVGEVNSITRYINQYVLSVW